MTNKSIAEKHKVAVIVLNYKGIEDTKSSLASLMQQTYTQFTVVAVENGSNDTSPSEFEVLEKQYGNKLHTIYNTKNLGFAGGVNTGIQWALAAGYPFIALFNNDALAEKTWLSSLVATIEHHDECGIVTGLLLLKNGKTIDSTGEQYSKWGLPFPRNRNDSIKAAPLKGYVFGATGGSSIYRAAMFRDIGLFDQDFFAYYEDTDISFRAQLADWKVYYQPTAVAYHQQGATSSKIPGFTIYQAFKNLPLVFIKNVPLELLLPVGIRFYTAYWLMFFHAIARSDGAPALKGLVQSSWYSIRALKKRMHIQKTKKVSTPYIKSILWSDLPPKQAGLRKVRRFLIGK